MKQEITKLIDRFADLVTCDTDPQSVSRFFDFLTTDPTTQDEFGDFFKVKTSDVFIDKERFHSFCKAAIAIDIYFFNKLGLACHPLQNKIELKQLARQTPGWLCPMDQIFLLQDASVDICRADHSYQKFFPILEQDNYQGFFDHVIGDMPTVLRVRDVSSAQILCLFASLRDRDIECHDLYDHIVHIAAKPAFTANITSLDPEIKEWADAIFESLKMLKLKCDFLTSDPSWAEKYANTIAVKDSKPETSSVDSECNSPEDALNKALSELSGLIGLTNVKTEIRRLSNFLKIEAKRKHAGLAPSKQSLHFVFTGNPGTGKTTVARILSTLLYGFEVLQQDKLVETDRSSLVGGYVGQTAIKTKEIIDSALDGVLFIDEAYTLSGKGENDFGQEAIDTLLKVMEDQRDSLVVVAAGYTDNMQEFLGSNPGLQSRFTRFIDFPDYTVKDLCKIYMTLAQNSDYTLTPLAMANLALIFNVLYSNRDGNFGNGRMVRNLFEQTISNQSDRLVELEDPSEDQLRTITEADLPFAQLNISGPQQFPDTLWKGQCPSCQKVFRAEIERIGRSVKCGCGEKFRFPFWNPIISNSELAKTIQNYDEEEGHLLFE